MAKCIYKSRSIARKLAFNSWSFCMFVTEIMHFENRQSNLPYFWRLEPPLSGSRKIIFVYLKGICWMGFRRIFGLKARDNDLHYAAVSTTAKLSTHSRLLSKVIHISRLQRTPFPSKYDSFVSNCRKSVHSVARKLRSIGDVSLIRDEVWTTL